MPDILDFSVGMLFLDDLGNLDASLYRVLAYRLIGRTSRASLLIKRVK